MQKKHEKYMKYMKNKLLKTKKNMISPIPPANHPPPLLSLQKFENIQIQK